MDRPPPTPGLPAVLVRLADAGVTGCLHVKGVGTSRVHLRAGRLLAVALAPDLPTRPLGTRLLAAGLVQPAALAEAQEAQRTELQGWRIGELLVHLGSADPLLVAPHVRDQLTDDLQTLLAAPVASTRFRPGDRVRGDLVEPLDLPLLLAALGHDVEVAEVVAEEPVPVEAAAVEPAPVEAAASAPDPVEAAPVETEPEPAEPDEQVEADDVPTDAELAAANTRDFADAFAAFSAPPPPEPAEEPVEVAALEPDEPEPAAPSRDRGWDRSDTDTAALLRELSSLGGPDPAPAPAAPPHRPAAPTSTPGSISAQQRKRKGLFGRV